MALTGTSCGALILWDDDFAWKVLRCEGGPINTVYSCSHGAIASQSNKIFFVNGLFVMTQSLTLSALGNIRSLARSRDGTKVNTT